MAAPLQHQHRTTDIRHHQRHCVLELTNQSQGARENAGLNSPSKINSDMVLERSQLHLLAALSPTSDQIDPYVVPAESPSSGFIRRCGRRLNPIMV